MLFFILFSTSCNSAHVQYGIHDQELTFKEKLEQENNKSLIFTSVKKWLRFNNSNVNINDLGSVLINFDHFKNFFSGSHGQPPLLYRQLVLKLIDNLTKMDRDYLNRSCCHGDTFLTLALRHISDRDDREFIVNFLLNSGASLKAKDKNGNNMMHIASRMPGLLGGRVIETIQKYDGNDLITQMMSQPNNAHLTPLRYALSNHEHLINIPVLNFMLNHTNDNSAKKPAEIVQILINPVDGNNGSSTFIKKLFESVRPTKKTVNSPIREQKMQEFCSFITKNLFGLSDYELKNLTNSLGQNMLHIISDIDVPEEISVKLFKTLYIRLSKPEINDMLCKHDNHGFTPLHYIVMYKQAKVFEMILKDCGKDTLNKILFARHNPALNRRVFSFAGDDPSLTPVHCMVRYNQEKMVKTIFNYCDKDTLNKIITLDNGFHTSILHYILWVVHVDELSKERGDKKVFQLFVSYLRENKEIDINTIKNESGRSILHACCSLSSRSYLDELLTIPGIDPTVEDNNGHTVFHNLISCGNSYLLEELFSRFSRYNELILDKKYRDGNTLIAFALLYGTDSDHRMEMFNILLNKCNPKVLFKQNDLGMTPLNMAKEDQKSSYPRINQNVIDMLKKKMASV